MNNEQIDALIEPILRAAGTSLRHYSMAKPKDEMRLAIRAVLALGNRATEPAASEPDNATPGTWFVRKRERDGEVLDCFIAAPDCNGFAYDAEILGDDEYREDSGIVRKLADCELICKLVNEHRALAAPKAKPVASEPTWQPIETADKYEAPVWLFCPDLIDEDVNPTGTVDGHWQDDVGWMGAVWNSYRDEWSTSEVTPTHWMARTTPAAPKTEPAASEPSATFPQKEFDALLDHIYEYGTVAEGIKELATAMIRAAYPAPQPAPTMADALAAGDGTLHGAVDHWQQRALRAEAALKVEPGEASNTTPIETLLAQYTEECCDFTNIKWVKDAAKGYVRTMRDSQVRCLLHTLANLPEVEPGEAERLAYDKAMDMGGINSADRFFIHKWAAQKLATNPSTKESP